MLCQNKCHIDRIIGIMADNIQIILNHQPDQTRPDHVDVVREAIYNKNIQINEVVAMNDVVCVMGAG
jgi:hypothetical protein